VYVDLAVQIAIERTEVADCFRVYEQQNDFRTRCRGARLMLVSRRMKQDFSGAEVSGRALGALRPYTVEHHDQVWPPVAVMSEVIPRCEKGVREFERPNAKPLRTSRVHCCRF
jgi:hypothetical protein